MTAAAGTSARLDTLGERKTATVSRLPASVLLPLLTFLLIIAFLLGVGIDAVSIGVDQIVAIILDHLGFNLDVGYTTQQDAVLWQIRLPRVILAAAIGASLAVSGATLQGIFRNPLADPGLIGVSSSAALAAVATIVIGFAPFGLTTLPIAAFIGGTCATAIVYVLGRYDGRTEVVTLLLTGIAVNAIAAAGTGMLTFLADDQQLRAIVFWSLGSLGGATWSKVTVVIPYIAAGLLLLPRWASALNLFVLGEREARHLGVDTERVRLILVAITALLVGASVAVAGTIGFVGLVVPHIIRLIAGPNHRTLLPATALAGASLLMLADLVARTVAIPAELPIGVLTAITGGPFFLFLLLRVRRAQGGWA